LTTFVDNRDDLGSLVGYTLLDSLYDFRTNSGSEEEIRLQETKAVYEGITNTINEVVENLKRTGGENASYEVLCDKIKHVDTRLKHDLAKESTQQSRLLKKILGNLPQKGYEDKVRRYGLRLVQTVEQRGEVTQTKEQTMIGDYIDIEACFTNRGRRL